MIDWIRISRTMKADPKVLAIADALNIRVAEAGGLLQFLFAEMAAQASDGRIGHLPNLTLEQWCGWEGKRGKLAPLIRELLLDDQGVVTAWEKYNGAALRASAAATERQRRHREKSRGHPESVTRDITRDASVTSLVDGTETGRDGDGELQERSSDGGSTGTPCAHAGEAPPVPSAARPPGTATATPELPPAAKELVARAYRSATAMRIADVQEQLLAALSVRGARLDRHTQVHAVDAEHLNQACRTAIEQLPQLRDPDKAAVLVLKILQETWAEVNARRGPDAPPPLSPAPRPSRPPKPSGSATAIGALIPDQIRRPA